MYFDFLYIHIKIELFNVLKIDKGIKNLILFLNQIYNIKENGIFESYHIYLL